MSEPKDLEHISDWAKIIQDAGQYEEIKAAALKGAPDGYDLAYCLDTKGHLHAGVPYKPDKSAPRQPFNIVTSLFETPAHKVPSGYVADKYSVDLYGTSNTTIRTRALPQHLMDQDQMKCVMLKDATLTFIPPKRQFLASTFVFSACTTPHNTHAQMTTPFHIARTRALRTCR